MEYPLGQSWNRSADGYGVFQALLYSYGGGWADEQGNYKSIVNDTWRTVVRWASEIYLTDKTVPPDAMSWTGFGNNEAFLTGKIAFTFNGPSIYYVLEKENRPILKDTVMAVKPAGPAGRNHDVFLLSWTVFNTSKQPELARDLRSEEHTSELQSRLHLVCRLLLEKKKKTTPTMIHLGAYEC